MLDRRPFVGDGIEGRQPMPPWAARRRFDKATCEAPDHPPEGGQHNMCGIHETNDPLARLGFGEPKLQTVFVHVSWASTSALEGRMPPWRGFLPRVCNNGRTSVGWRAIPGRASIRTWIRGSG